MSKGNFDELDVQARDREMGKGVASLVAPRTHTMSNLRHASTRGITFT